MGWKWERGGEERESWEVKGIEKRREDVQDIEISSPGSMSRYALIAIETPARENRTKELGLQAWFIRW